MITERWQGQTPACAAPTYLNLSHTHAGHHRDTERLQKHRELPLRHALSLCGGLCFCGVREYV